MEKMPKNATEFFCKECNFICCKKSNYDKHLTTRKHKNRTNLEQKMPKNAEPFICKNCNKHYKAKSSLWYHEQKCGFSSSLSINENDDNDDNNDEINELKEFMKYLMKDNSEMKTMMMEVIKNGTHNITHTNSHNKAFNLQFFLNETCKDAMNMADFVDSIKFQLSDLERVGELGYVEGISNIIVEKLKCLDVTQRPVHCTDKKRETIYIKDEDKWEKDEENDKMHKIIRRVSDKNARLLPKFKEAHPDCNKASSQYSDQFNKIIVESMGGPGNNNYEKEEKIIKRVSREIIVEKEL
jgi:hypothetical protein